MRPIRVPAVSSVTTSAVIPMDTYPLMNATIGVAATGTLTFDVQFTLDDVFSNSFSAGSATWYTLSTMSGKTASAYSLLDFPVMALRLNVTAYTSGSAAMTIIQTGPEVR